MGTIQKMEVRIEELEVMINNEKKSHSVTMTELHTKTRSIKELILQSEEDRKNILILQESLDRLNEKIKMYKRQLEEQESISNSNIMRVKKFQRELEAAECRAEEAESSLNAFRSQQRVFAAAAESRRTTDSKEVESEVVVKKTVMNVNRSNVNANAVSSSSTAIQSSSQNALQSSSSSAMQSSSSASRNMQSSSSASREYRAGSTAAYSRAGSMARTSMVRGTSMGRASSMLRY